MKFGLSGLSMAMRILNQNRELAKHSFNVARTCKEIIALLPEGYLLMPVNNICLAALYHDIGKSSWFLEWFYKPKTDLTDEEIKEMQKHAIAGAKLLQNLVPGIPKEIIKLIREHHERPGGIGYPNQLKEVSNETLLLAACDVYCACQEKRKYREKVFTFEETMDILAEFAPLEIINAFFKLQKEDCHGELKFGT